MSVNSTSASPPGLKIFERFVGGVDRVHGKALLDQHVADQITDQHFVFNQQYLGRHAHVSHSPRPPVAGLAGLPAFSEPTCGVVMCSNFLQFAATMVTDKLTTLAAPPRNS